MKINIQLSQKQYSCYIFKYVIKKYECKFSVVEIHAVDLLLRTLILDRCTSRNLLAARNLLPWHYGHADILVDLSKTRKAVSFSGHGYPTTLASDTRQNAVPAKRVNPAPCSHIHVMVPSTCSGLLFIKRKPLHTTGASLQVAREVIKVAPSKLCNVLLTTLPRNQVFRPDYMIITQAIDQPRLVAPVGYFLRIRTGHTSCGALQTAMKQRQSDVMPRGSYVN